MSTTTQTTATKAALSMFLRTFKDAHLQVETCQSMILVSCVTDGTNVDNIKRATICVGDHDGEDVRFKISHKDLTNYVRNTNAKDALVFTVGRDDEDKHQLIIDSETIGMMMIGSTDQKGGEPDRIDVFGKLGEFKHTISLGDLKIAGTIADRTDQESSRYALGCVLFDEGQVIATDGRRLALVETESQYPAVTMVDTRIVEYATKFGYDVDVFDHCLIAGDVVVSKLEGRYPTWRQVIPEADNLTSMSGDELRKLVDGHIARNKAAGVEDEWGVDVQLGDVRAKLDSRFIKAAIGKLKSISVAYSEKRQGKGKDLTVPVVLTSLDRPGWLEVVMPMARDR